ncbi:oligoribonuclease [Candidatus Campbellbacteria bacterium]|nr:MAG: oligoribonuclease [Candidatus Campbellbacteria bacterium]
MKNKKEENLIWIDAEFSGLDKNKDRIIEIAVLVTNSNLKIQAIGPNIAIKTPKKILNNMDKWNTEHHTESGLVEKCLKSKITTKQAEKKILDFLEKWTLPQTSPLCGNSIGQDRIMILKDMPKLAKYFHYRSIDVSTIKELSQRWYKNKYIAMKKKQTHTALSDIEESIDELKYYKKNVFKKTFGK